MSDWSSDVCSSDLGPDQPGSEGVHREEIQRRGTAGVLIEQPGFEVSTPTALPASAFFLPMQAVFSMRGAGHRAEIGIASGRDRVCQYWYISVGAVSLQKKNVR